MGVLYYYSPEFPQGVTYRKFHYNGREKLPYGFGLWVKLELDFWGTPQRQSLWIGFGGLNIVKEHGSKKPGIKQNHFLIKYNGSTILRLRKMPRHWPKELPTKPKEELGVAADMLGSNGLTFTEQFLRGF